MAFVFTFAGIFVLVFIFVFAFTFIWSFNFYPTMFLLVVFVKKIVCLKAVQKLKKFKRAELKTTKDLIILFGNHSCGDIIIKSTTFEIRMVRYMHSF